MNADPSAEPRPGLAARITERRTRLGLTEDMLAARAGMAPRYLQQLVQADAAFDPAGLLRIAAALDLTYRELLEGRSDPPPGQAGAAPRPTLARLTASQCWDLLGTHGVGRIALPAPQAPTVFPVNYTVDAGAVLYRTDPRGAAAPEAGSAVSFQADRIDDRLSSGWSVLIIGTVQHVTDPDTVRRLAELPGTEPWAGGHRPLWVRIRPDEITGRVIDTT